MGEEKDCQEVGIIVGNSLKDSEIELVGVKVLIDVWPFHTGLASNCLIRCT